MVSIVFPAGSTALVKKHVPQNILDRLADRKTNSGFTLARALASGIANPDSSIGIYAGDAQSYEVFSAVFDPVIRAYHGKISHEEIPRFPEPEDLPDPDPENRYILSSRIRVARNIEDYEFTCHIPSDRRKELEHKIVTVLKEAGDGLSGVYIPLSGISPSEKKRLDSEGILFEKGDRFQDAAGMNSDFPKYRGVFYTPDKRVRIWVNEEDHLRIISMYNGSGLDTACKRLGTVLKLLGASFNFAWDKRLGFLASCPTNIGTSMRAGVHIRLKRLEKRKQLLSDLAGKHHLQIRGTGGEKTKVEGAVFDISNRRRLGISETNLLKGLCTGLHAIIRAEQSV